jgi:hypothetical protein
MTLACIDDNAMRHKVETARNLIYNKFYAVDKDGVEAILKDESLVPSSVSACRLD